MNRGRGGSRGGGGGGGGGRHYYSPRGRPQRSPGQWVVRHEAGAGAHLDDASSGSGSSEVGSRNPETASVGGVTKKFDMLLSDNPNGPNSDSHDSCNVSPSDGNLKVVQNVPGTEPKPSNVPSTGPCYDNDFPSLSPYSESEPNVRINMINHSRDQGIENQSPSCIISTPPQTVGCQFSQEVRSGKTASEETSGKNKLNSPDSQHDGDSFDICKDRVGSVVALKTPLHLKNKALRNEKRLMQGDNIQIFGPGMILLKGYLSLKDQVKLVKSCRDLGRGPGGFYQPGYCDGAKLHLKMMCLGKNWDPETSSYGDKRPIDQAKPPPIPNEFQRLVKEAIQECHRYLESDKGANARNILPPMSPNICIINFYTRTGKLGLHQDKDESPESLWKGLPVVSFSLGDTAEFLFGDNGDVDKAHKVELKSGDVLIFGGKSRHIFHGVSKILAETAPAVLLEETRLKPGRLNLTFREH
ncbi:hypothetical protein C2S53_008473 [Perilla frutescens var. hirtella]|uniref:Fe2OG dioxygenase domain-containing protein n=1 Tax=Perilla frutescens var. hirtella TaxID=608512 RepID=A0AAD4PA92_PERFH|nr:hypothetical protein C2S53_008473 [Perilla frutescens var. hirtella]